MAGTKITPHPEWDALHQFDADNNVEPARTIAERLAWKYGAGATHSLVDDIAHAIEDAMELGQKRAAFLPTNAKPALSGYTDAEIYKEWYQRGQIRIGDPRSS